MVKILSVQNAYVAKILSLDKSEVMHESKFHLQIAYPTNV